MDNEKGEEIILSSPFSFYFSENILQVLLSPAFCNGLSD